MGTIATVLGMFDPSGRVAHRIARLWGKLVILSSGIKVTITGMENLLTDRPQIFISNHQGIFDIFSIAAYFPVQLKWIAKKELFRIPFLGWSMRAARYISIDREHKRSAIRSIERSVRAINKGFSVVIFPEGTRSLDGELLPFKRGSLILINKAGAPIVPVTISGSSMITSPKRFMIKKNNIHIKIDAPIYTESMSKEERKGLLERIKQQIQKNLDDMAGASDENR